jgi:hypothetical protein
MMTRAGLSMVAACVAACGGVAASSRDAPESPQPTVASPAVEATSAVAEVPVLGVDTTMFNGKQVRGRLEPDRIRSVVVEHVELFARCYDEGRRTSPTLQGKVTVKFEIDPNGIVTKSADARSDLPDAAVVQCVVDAYRTLRFPKPDGGVVTVYFPLIFNPRD